MIRLVIFDLDGTLINTLTDIAESTNYALKKHGFASHAEDAYRYMVGNGIEPLIRRALPEHVRDEETIALLMSDFKEYYLEHGEDFTKPYDGVLELLDELKSRGIKMAVATNKFQAAALELVPRFFGEGTFDIILGQRDGIATKPDPIIVEQIMSELNVAKEDVLYLGDTSVDMETAVRGGIKAIGVTWGFRDVEELLASGADHIIDAPMELVSLL
ncbi:MAG: HAD family hydrolase [Bacteroidales bacterium]